MAEGARIAEAAGAADHRHQHGLPGQARDQRAIRLGADARPRSCAHADRGDGRRGQRAGDAEDAARLGRPLDQRARARAPRGGRRRPHDHACTAAPAASSTTARADWTAVRAVKDARLDSGGRQRRHPTASTTPTRRSRPPAPTPSWSAARAQGRPWLPGQIARYLATGRREARAAAGRAACADRRALRRDAGASRRCASACKHARKHLGWALDAAAATAGVARRHAQALAQRAC